MDGGRMIARSVFVSKYDPNYIEHQIKVDVAIVTSRNAYYEYEIPMQSDILSTYNADKIRQVFARFQLTPDTNVTFLGDAAVRSPFYEFMRILQSQFGFPMRQTTVQKMVKRLQTTCGLYKDKEVSDMFLQKMWRAIAESGGCPWITAEYTQKLFSQKGDWSKKRRKQLVRFGAYYQQIKVYWNEIERKRKRLKN